MRVVADSHTIVWYVQDSGRLGADAAAALDDAEASDGIVVSVATLVDLWYVTQTTQGVSVNDLTRLRSALESAPKVDLDPIDVAVADAVAAIPRDVLSDPSSTSHLDHLVANRVRSPEPGRKPGTLLRSPRRPATSSPRAAGPAAASHYGGDMKVSLRACDDPTAPSQTPTVPTSTTAPFPPGFAERQRFEVYMGTLNYFDPIFTCYSARLAQHVAVDEFHPVTSETVVQSAVLGGQRLDVLTDTVAGETVTGTVGADDTITPTVVTTDTVRFLRVAQIPNPARLCW